MAGTGISGAGTRTIQDQLRACNAVYDSADSVLWHRGVYQAVHDGWRFTNIGGKAVLDFIGAAAGLTRASQALEIGSGLGDTCRYLSSQFGCSVVGVDMNATQVRRAREMAHQHGMTGRLTFVQASIEEAATVGVLADLLAVEGVDVVYTLDVLMLTADPASVIRAAVPMLRRGGVLALAEVTSGPRMTDDLRERLWKGDGMRTLWTPAAYAAALRAAGFGTLQMIDRTPFAVRCFAKMADAFRQHEAEIMQDIGAAHYDDWLTITDLYHQWFRNGELQYTQMLGR